MALLSLSHTAQGILLRDESTSSRFMVGIASIFRRMNTIGTLSLRLRERRNPEEWLGDPRGLQVSNSTRAGRPNRVAGVIADPGPHTT
jgi:hypothetical protein